jgi:hypothetical protein
MLPRCRVFIPADKLNLFVCPYDKLMLRWYPLELAVSAGAERITPEHHKLHKPHMQELELFFVRPL